MKIKIPILFLLLLSLLAAPVASATSNCPSPSTGKVYWDGMELKIGQLGRLTVTNATTLYKNNNGVLTSDRPLQVGERYRVYALKADYYSVGGGFAVKKDTKSLYETPSKSKLNQLACKKQNSNIGLNLSSKEVESSLGKPVKKLTNEFNTQTYIYHNNYDHFYSIYYLHDHAAAVYTKDANYNYKGVKIGSSSSEVTTKLGKKYESIGNTSENEIMKYIFPDHTVYLFIDTHNSNKVSAIYSLSTELLEKNKGLYPDESSVMQNSYESILFELTNSERKAKGLTTLKQSSQATQSARLHSKDMSDHDFFSHDNLKGESPFDRMKNAGIKYRHAGENIAMGYTNPYFAHEALMNSIGHRRNILSPNYTYLGIGVDFALWDYGAIPYYTENFYTP